MEMVWTYMLVRHAVYAKICTSVYVVVINLVTT